MPSFKSMIVSFTLVASALAGQPSPAQVEKAIHFNEGSLELTRRPFPDYYKSKMIKLADFEAFHITFRAGGTICRLSQEYSEPSVQGLLQRAKDEWHHQVRAENLHILSEMQSGIQVYGEACHLAALSKHFSDVEYNVYIWNQYKNSHDQCFIKADALHRTQLKNTVQAAKLSLEVAINQVEAIKADLDRMVVRVTALHNGVTLFHEIHRSLNQFLTSLKQKLSLAKYYETHHDQLQSTAEVSVATGYSLLLEYSARGLREGISKLAEHCRELRNMPVAIESITTLRAELDVITRHHLPIAIGIEFDTDKTTVMG